MGLKEWALGWASTLPFNGVQSPAPSADEQVGVSVEPVEMPGDFELLVKGTSYRQGDISKLGLGTRKFMLAPESTNKKDSNAVMVFGLVDETPFHVGYLPRDTQTTIAAHELGKLMLAKGEAMMLNGEVMPGDTGLIVRIEMPGLDYMAHLQTEYS